MELKSFARRILGEQTLGFIDYFRFPELRESWGGPFNGQISRQAIFLHLISVGAPRAIVESGTFRGTTTAYMASESAVPLFTVDINPRFYGFARARLRGLANVVMENGDSRYWLQTWLDTEQVLGDRVLFYLDAHWNTDLPLAGELRIIFSRCPRAMVMIDDFLVPDDPGYGYDDYGQGKALNADYIAAVVSQFSLIKLYPFVRSENETGARRGCVVLVADVGLAEDLARGKHLRLLQP